MLNVRIVNLDFGKMEVDYASKAQLVDNMLLLHEGRECKAKKAFVKELRGEADEKGVIDYGRDTPHIYAFRRTKPDVFVGSDINVVIGYIAKHKLEDVRVTFELTTVKDGEAHKTEVTEGFKFPASEDRDEIRDRLFRNGDFIYQQGSWYSLIIEALVEEKEERNKALEEQSEENNTLLCDLNLLRTYVKDLCNTLTPDIPTDIFNQLGDKDNWQNLVTGALQSISAKIATLLPNKVTAPEIKPPVVKIPSAIHGSHRDFDGDQLNDRRYAIDKIMRNSLSGAHAGFGGFGLGEMVISAMQSRPTARSMFAEIIVNRSNDKHLLSRVIGTKK